MEYECKCNYQREFIFVKDIYASEIFQKIRNHFVNVISKEFPSDIFPKHKKKIRVFHNMFSQWYFWESYNKELEEYPLIIRPPYKHTTFYQVLKDYSQDKVNVKDKINKFISKLNLEEKFNDAFKKLNEMENYQVIYKINHDNLFSISLKGILGDYYIKFPFDIYDKLSSKIGVHKTIALIFRYYVLASNNNQLALHPKLMKKLNANVELFASGFNNYYHNFGSLFPDIEMELGSIGRFQDLVLKSGKFQINPPFQITIIYDMLYRVKHFIEEALCNYRDLTFEIILPNWDNNDKGYDEYQVRNILKEMPGKITFLSKNKEEFPYYDYWKETKRDVTLPDSYFIKITTVV